MRSLILSTAANYLLPLLLLLSFYLLLTGHNTPGGGFVGGLVASSAFALYMIANSVESVRLLLRVSPRRFIGIGLLIALVSGLISMATGKAFMTGLWAPFEVPFLKKVGTPVLFDLGVYVVVVGVTLTIILTLAED